MKKRIGVLAALIAACVIGGCGQNAGGAADSSPEKRTYYTLDYFDTGAQIVGYEDDEDRFNEICAYIESELARYDSLYDNYTAIDGVNNLYAINRDAGSAPVTADEDVIRLFLLGKEIYELTDGKTNYAMGAVFLIWHDHREEASADPDSASVPSYEELSEAAKHCNPDDIIIDEDASTIYYADPDLKCDVGAFAKGYAIGRIAQDLIAMGVDGYSLNVGGNVYTIGTKPDGGGWKIAIQNPGLDPDESYAEVLRFSDLALATSGSYQRYYEVDGVRYCHIIDPDTLYPKDTFLSVSVLNKDAGIGDALSTALFNMTLEEGQALTASLDDTEALWILADGSKVYSDGFAAYIKNE